MRAMFFVQFFLLKRAKLELNSDIIFWNTKVNYLCFPPPFSSMHIMIEMDSHILIYIMSFRWEDQMLCKSRISNERSNAIHNWTIVKVNRDPFIFDSFQMELWSSRDFTVNNVIELSGSFECKAQCFWNLYKIVNENICLNRNCNYLHLLWLITQLKSLKIGRASCRERVCLYV